MGRMYSAEFANVATATAAKDMFELIPADDEPLRIHCVSLSQDTDLSDAAEEVLQVEIIRGYTTTGSGGGTPTEHPLNPKLGLASADAKTNNTTVATGGTAIRLHTAGWNIRTEFLYLPTEAMMPYCSQGENRIVVRISAPADAITVSGTIVWEEL